MADKKDSESKGILIELDEYRILTDNYNFILEPRTEKGGFDRSRRKFFPGPVAMFGWLLNKGVKDSDAKKLKNLKKVFQQVEADLLDVAKHLKKAL